MSMAESDSPIRGIYLIFAICVGSIFAGFIITGIVIFGYHLGFSLFSIPGIVISLVIAAVIIIVALLLSRSD